MTTQTPVRAKSRASPLIAASWKARQAEIQETSRSTAWPTATTAEYLYDYAGQDPINKYDLSGTYIPEDKTSYGAHKGKAAWGGGSLNGYSPAAAELLYVNGAIPDPDVLQSSDLPAPNSTEGSYAADPPPASPLVAATQVEVTPIDEIEISSSHGVTETGPRVENTPAGGFVQFLCKASNGPTPFSPKQLLNPSIFSQLFSDITSVLVCPPAAN